MILEEVEEGSLEGQLNLLYAEKEKLEAELGTSDASEIIEMVRSLEAQLNDLYREKENATQTQFEVQLEGNKVIILGPETVVIRKKKT